jgi:hypothetical protein
LHAFLLQVLIVILSFISGIMEESFEDVWNRYCFATFQVKGSKQNSKPIWVFYPRNT